MRSLSIQQAARQAAADPLSTLLQSAADRTSSPAVRQWLRAMLAAPTVAVEAAPSRAARARTDRGRRAARSGGVA